MSRENEAMAALIASYRGQDLDANYLAYFDCFNRRLYFEAHEVLEKLWLKDPKGADGAFYKGLIQLAGAFVHVQRKRPQPAVALFKLARRNIAQYPAAHYRLDVTAILELVDHWQRRLEGEDISADPLDAYPPPRILLMAAGKQ